MGFFIVILHKYNVILKEATTPPAAPGKTVITYTAPGTYTA